jgi:hypothetical protein
MIMLWSFYTPWDLTRHYATTNMFVRFWAHGGSFQGRPSLKEMSYLIALVASPSRLGMATPGSDGDLIMEQSPIDVNKLSDSITVMATLSRGLKGKRNC